MARETKGSGNKGSPVLDSGTSGPHECSREVSIYCVGESWRFYFSSRFLCFKQPIEKFQLIQKSHVPRALRFSCKGSTA